VLISSVRPTERADVRKAVRDALSYALDLGHNRQKWTDRTGGLDGYDLWIETMERGRAGRFGLGYNAAVWAESRRFAVAFLCEAKERLGDDLRQLFDRASAALSTRESPKTSKTFPTRTPSPSARTNTSEPTTAAPPPSRISDKPARPKPPASKPWPNSSPHSKIDRNLERQAQGPYLPASPQRPTAPAAGGHMRKRLSDKFGLG